MSDRKKQVEAAVRLARTKGLHTPLAAWLLFRNGNGQGVTQVADHEALESRALIQEGAGLVWHECEEKPGRLFLFSAVRVMRAMEQTDR
jgi:hypothetical protein